MTDAPINFPVPARPKDPTAAERARRYRARKRALVTAPGTSMIPAETVTATVTNVTVMPPHVCGGRFLAVVLIIAGLGLGGAGLVLNFQFGASLGRSPVAALLLGGIGVALDVLGMLLPATGAQLWQRGRMLAITAWVLWPAVLVMTLLAATGFAAGNLGDAIAGRERDAVAAVNLRAELDRARAERATIAEARSAGEIEAALARTKVPDWARPCTAPDTAETRRACSGVLALRQAEAVAQRRDHLDADVHRLETRLATFPVVGLADPTTFAAEIVSWISAGRFQPSAADVYRVRIIGLVVAPSLAGVVLMLAAGLIGGRRQ